MNPNTKLGNSDTFYEYLNSRKQDFKEQEHDGYYHVNVVADAYSQGFTDGKDTGRKDIINKVISDQIESFTQEANQIYILSKKLIEYLKENSFQCSGLYMNMSYRRPSVIISVRDEVLNNDDFVQLAYSKVHDSKTLFSSLFDKTLDMGLVSHDNLDENLLREDGFNYIENYT